MAGTALLSACEDERVNVVQVTIDLFPASRQGL
jgi:hypothetical protein